MIAQRLRHTHIETAELLLQRPLCDLKDAYKHVELNPTFCERWGMLTRDGSEFTRLPDRSEVNVDGEREFWFKYDRYVGRLIAVGELGDGTPGAPGYVERGRRFR